jgi:23S rRNA (cytosine1962-C5)-methyltransferase
MSKAGDTPTRTGFNLLVADGWSEDGDGYCLIDSGDFLKLERFGRHTLQRPDPQAFWKPERPIETWAPDAIFNAKGDEDGGRWQETGHPLPEAWVMNWNSLRFEARCTAFRHMGVFPEHAVHWDWAQRETARVRSRLRAKPSVLNLFGYTGLMSLACAEAGADVTHLDASPKAIGYGRANQTLSGLDDASIRWICDDAIKFLRREVKRGRRYHGVILDPPKHGRGPNGETWKLEEGYGELMALVRAVLDPEPAFVIATVYAVRLSYLTLEQTLADTLEGLGGEIEAGDMAIAQTGWNRPKVGKGPIDAYPRLLPTAIYARWRSS